MLGLRGRDADDSAARGVENANREATKIIAFDDDLDIAFGACRRRSYIECGEAGLHGVIPIGL
jgi:peptidyl-tRNA hydrolase